MYLCYKRIGKDTDIRFLQPRSTKDIDYLNGRGSIRDKLPDSTQALQDSSYGSRHQWSLRERFELSERKQYHHVSLLSSHEE